VEGALLAYRRPASAPAMADEASEVRMTFSSRCGEPITKPALLARHLRIGIPANVVRESGPLELGSLPGWQQVFDADAARGAVRVKTVTFVADGCALDWVLIARDAEDFERAQTEFDAWWRTLSVPAAAAPASTTAGATEPEPAP
jgi:hypothetical protein